MASESTAVEYNAYSHHELDMRPVYGNPMVPLQLPIPAHHGYGPVYEPSSRFALPYHAGFPPYQQQHTFLGYAQGPMELPCLHCLECAKAADTKHRRARAVPK